jgi:putative FmdB family regulatory protein
MATYDLVCLECDRNFEVFVPGFIKDEDRQCPACGSFKTRQKYSTFLTNASSSSGSPGSPGSPGCADCAQGSSGGGFT